MKAPSWKELEDGRVLRIDLETGALKMYAPVGSNIDPEITPVSNKSARVNNRRNVVDATMDRAMVYRILQLSPVFMSASEIARRACHLGHFARFDSTNRDHTRLMRVFVHSDMRTLFDEGKIQKYQIGGGVVFARHGVPVPQVEVTQS